MKQNLILDFDDTLVHFVRPWLKWLRSKGLTKEIFSSKDVVHYDWFQKNFGETSLDFFLKEPDKIYNAHGCQIPGSIAFLKRVQRLFNVKIVTHTSNENILNSKSNFIKNIYHRNHNLNIDVSYFEILHDKYKHIDGILVDDFPLHIINHAAHNKQPAILFNYKNENGWGYLENYKELIKDLNPNMELIHYATNYEEILDILEMLKK